MLETMYAVTEQTGTEAESAVEFARQFVRGNEMEDKFYAAIRDSRLSGFKEGMKTALMLLAEVRQ